MSEEETKKAEELAAATLASEQKTKEEGIDYKIELEKERKLREAKEKELGQAQYKIQELKKKKEDDFGDDTPPSFNKEELLKEARDEVRKEIERVQTGFAQDSLLDALKSASSDQAEQDLIKFQVRDDFD